MHDPARKPLMTLAIATALTCLSWPPARAIAALPEVSPPTVRVTNLAPGQQLRNASLAAKAATGRLTLGTNGSGRIYCFFRTNLLDVGQRYLVRALPGRGQLFTGWDGTIQATANPLSFTMQSNMVLTANFVENPFIPLQGTYNGLFYQADMMGGFLPSTSSADSGFFTLTLAAGGSFSGRAGLAGTNLPFSGAFNLDLQSQAIVQQPGRAPLAFSLELAPEARAILGWAELSEGRTSSLLARRAAAGKSNAFAGTYSLMVVGCDGTSCFVGPPVPMGDSPATVKVSPTGAIQMAGTLSDNAGISQSTAVSEDGYWPLYVSPYRGHGLLLGWLNFADYAGTASVMWEKEPPKRGDRYTNGFTSPRVAVVTRYTLPPQGQNAVDWTNGTVVINSGNLPTGVRLTNEIALVNNRARVSGGSISNLTLTINPANGLFQGTFMDPVTARPQPFSGSVMQSSPEFFRVASGGWFLGTNTGGTIRLHPRE